MQTKILIGGAVAIIVLGSLYALMSASKTEETPIITTEVSDNPVVTNTEAPTTTVSPATPAAPANTSKPAVGTTGTSGVSPTSNVPPPVPTTPAPAPFVATVYYDGSNFTPEVLTIPEGGTVQFENLSDKPMWVASANHPTHAKYPVKNPGDCLGSSFDQCKSSGKGTSWSYTFSELGEWRYHNHVRDFDTGRIIVLTKEKYLRTLEE